MFFTKEDYKKIENWLKLNSIKDSQLPELKSSLDKDDIVAIVHKGESVKVKLSLLSAYLQSGEFGELHADKFIENGIPISDIYASKSSVVEIEKKASQVVNTGTCNSLQEAILKIQHRVPLQIVTFINKQKSQRKRVVVWFDSLPNDGQMRVFIGSVASEWFNLVGSTIEKRNQLVYDSIINDPDLSSYIYSSSFSADHHQMIFTFTESVGGADITTEQRNNSSIVSMTTYNVTSDFVEGLESYQFKLDYQASTSDAFFENPDNWEEYNKKEEEQDATWEEF